MLFLWQNMCLGVLAVRSWQQFEACRKRERQLKKQKKRLVLLTIVFILFVAVSMTQIQAVSGEHDSYTEVIVQKGDNLWTLSRLYKPENVDTRDYIETILSLNNLDSAVLYPGQVLKMP